MRPAPATVIIIWLIIIVCSAALLISSVRIASDLTSFLAGESESGDRTILEALRSGAGNRTIILSLEGAPAERLAQTSNRLIATLRKTGQFEYALNGSLAGREHDLDKLFKWRYLLSSNIKEGRFEPEQLRLELLSRLDELSSLTGAFTQKNLQADPTAEFRTVAQNMSGNIERATKHGVWFSPNGNRALMLLSSNASAFDIDEQEKLINLIKETFKAINTSSEMELGFTGPGIFSVESRTFIKAEAQRITVTASLIVMLFLLLLFRSFTAIILSALPLLTGVIFAITTVQLFFGYVHGITIAFGATIVGVAVDYPIHLMSHKMKGGKARETANRIGSTMIIGAITTSIGYAAMVFSGFVGLNQLGLFSIVGTLVAVISARYILPIAIPDSFFLPERIFRLAVIRSIADHANLVTPVLIVLSTLAATFLLFGSTPLWNDDISQLNVISENSRKLDKKLRAELNAPDAMRLITVKGASVEQILQTSEALAIKLDTLVEQGSVGGYDMAARYLPSLKTQQLRQSSIPDEELLRKNVSIATSGLIFKEKTFEPFIQDVIAASSSQLVDVESIRGTPIGLKLSLLLTHSRGESIALVPLHNVQDENDLIELVKSIGANSVRYINIKNESTKLISKYRSEAVTVCLFGSLAIIVALFFFLGSIRDMGRVLISVAGPIAIVLFVLSRWEGGLSIFHLVSILLVAGLGIDYTLFLNRHSSVTEERDRALSSTLICNISTILVFGILAMSELYVLSAIGATVFLGATLSLVFGLATRRAPNVPNNAV